jgi:hypothetical protein
MLKPHPLVTTIKRGSARRSERRSAVRAAPFRVTPCYLSAPEEGIGVSAWVYNLSAKGVGIVSPKRIAPGTSLTVELINAGHTYALALEMLVTRADAVRTGDHYLGGQFSRSLVYNELLPFLV